MRTQSLRWVIFIEMKEPDYVAVGKRIKAFRSREGISQEQLAERSGLSKTHMSHMETGSTKSSTPAFIAVANALHVTLDDLMCDSLVSATVSYHKEIAALTEDCTPLEIRIIADTIRGTKEILRRYGLSNEGEQ